MQRWEYVGGGSAKFWEVERDGAVVTVRFGRLAASGQTKVRELASEAAAQSYVDKLVAEKSSRGYRLVERISLLPPSTVDGAAEFGPGAEPTGAESGGTAELPDEDTFEIPAGWRAHIHPRRGGVARTSTELDPVAAATVEQRAVRVRTTLTGVLSRANSDPRLVGAAREWVDGTPNPLGAAVEAAVVASMTEWEERADLQFFADFWVSRHGFAFAARSAAELAGIAVHWRSPRRWDPEVPRHVFFPRPRDIGARGWYGEPVALRTRALLASADDQDYQDAVAALASHRQDELQRVITTYLVPTRQDWVDECCADAVAATRHERIQLQMLVRSLGSPRQVEELEAHVELGWCLDAASVVHTLVEGVGVAVAPVLARAADGDPDGGAARRRLLATLAQLPTDEAFDLLVARVDQKHVQAALRAAMRRYPVRALRRLARAAEGYSGDTATIAMLLRGHVAAHPGLTAAVLPSLPEELAEVVQRAGHTTEKVREAPADTLPRLLVEPPWTRRKAAAKPVVIEGLAPVDPKAIEWADGEREEWANHLEHTSREPFGGDWDEAVETFRAGGLDWYDEGRLFLRGPEHLVRPLLADWTPRDLWSVEGWVKALVARFELAALPIALRVAMEKVVSNAPVLLPFVTAEVATLMADWLARLRTTRSVALTWLLRHPVGAARLLVPAALSKPGVRRRNAEGALRAIASAGRRDEVLAVAREYGERAGAAVEALLDLDPVEVLPARRPVVGTWVDLALLPPILLRDRESALPRSAAGHVVTMLAMSRTDEVYAGLDVVREVCDPDSLAEFGWGLFQQWRAVGAPTRDNWALTALGWIGDDRTVLRLVPVIRAWPGQDGHSKAVAGLGVLAGIGSDLALTHLYSISQKARSRGLRERARQKVAEVAEGLGLSAEQLADRLVPDFGLDADGTLALDYGPRQFVVGFDEQLKPYVVDGDGKRRKDLPRPGARDDQELAPAAHKRFAALKKDVRTVARDQFVRLERAMVAQRRWSVADFRRLFVEHPLLWHITRRLVWRSEEDGRPATLLRVTENRGFANVAGEELALPDSAQVGIAHPLHIAESLSAWSEVFANYEIQQPFPQLGRPVHALTDEERESVELRRFHDVAVPVGRVVGLRRRGWERGTPLDNGVEFWISRPVPGGRCVVIDLDPGITAGELEFFPEQRIARVWLNDEPTGNGNRPGLRFAELDPVTASEVLAELTDLTNLTNLTELVSATT
ncbi:DUF4132 domain-containing protein [Streptoalloteichus hindustanus]|uniref:WGR domain-containing protein n=1 Tax=Streptoalloteichus hindustanus TaxID=2017 RepID=A0A1M4Z0A1_STRHI|nr:DUF4132 domain-containing protein [Streptoalloteichus hindustanus]SHF10996.1 WGR domain-containing protein [Streptoalloteichus hindustanus]